MRLITATAVLMVLSGFVLDSVKLSFFDVTERNSDFLVVWQSESESGLDRYELLRRTQTTNNEFVFVASVRAHGVGKPYELMDTQVFKVSSELVDYRLEAVYGSGAREILISKSVNYTPTAVRRTWGSIKAMFQ